MTKRLECSDYAGIPVAKKSRVSLGEKVVRTEQCSNSDEDSQDEMDTCSGTAGSESTKHEKSEAEVGIIEEMTLINFMCHRRLTVRFGPNVNVIVGRNGSGKSAIMTAMVVALGGTARNTVRGSSLKQFIKSGERFAEVIISLRNSGVEAFKPDKYGKRFTVVRLINQDGTGSYKIKGANGKIVSTSKEELVNFLDHCGIQINNPVSILHQDTSRNFLHSSSPAVRYDLFMKATRLEQMDMDYDKCKEEQKLMSDRIQQNKNLLPSLKAEAKELEDRMRYFERLQEKMNRLEELERESSWAKVIEIEQLIGPAEERVKRGQERIKRRRQKTKQAESVVTQEKEKQTKATEELNQATQVASEAKIRLDAVSIEVRNKEKELQVLKKEVYQIDRQINDAKSEMDALQSVLNDRIVASQRDKDGEREAVLTQMNHHQEQLKRLQSDITTGESEQSKLVNIITTCKSDLQSHQNDVRGKEAQLKSSEERLHRLQTSHSDKLSVFDPRMRKLVDTLQKNRQRFRIPPKGPIGAMICLKDYKWSCAVEQALKKSILRAFVVDNEQDAAVFKQIVRSVYGGGYKPECITSPFSGQMYDVSRNRPHCAYHTIVDVLDVRDADIVNVLIDQCSVECMLLIERPDEARYVMAHQRPRGARAAWTIEGDEVLAHAYYSNKRGKYGIIQSSVDDTIREERSKLEEIRCSLSELKVEDNKQRSDLRKYEHELREMKEKIKRKLEEKNKCEQQIVELKNVLEEMESEGDDVATYESEIKESEEIINSLVRNREESVGTLHELEQARLLCYSRKDECQKEVDRATEALLETRARFNEQSHICNQAERRLTSSKKRLKEVQDAVQKLEAELGEIQQDFQSTAQSAIGERIETSRSQTEITREIQSISKFLQAEQPSMEQQEAEQDRYIEAMRRFESTRELIRDARRALSALKSGLECRTKNYETFKDRIIDRTRTYFFYFLKDNGFEGKLKFSRKSGRGLLDVIVNCEKTSVSQSTRDLKCLSGGERSFATVCFIMSLWDAIEAPFRCLDEFDVFMDMKNRKASMKLMLNHAKCQPHRQFIFLTPLSMSSMGISTLRTVKVHKLQDPDRGQSTLDLD